jgi:hypothetical protein
MLCSINLAVVPDAAMCRVIGCPWDRPLETPEMFLLFSSDGRPVDDFGAREPSLLHHLATPPRRVRSTRWARSITRFGSTAAWYCRPAEARLLTVCA